jgi:hypothetical protein
MIQQAVVPKGQVVPVFSSDGAPLPIDWLAIVRWYDAPRPDSYELIFYSAEGEPQEWLWFETAEIARDQGCDIAGLPLSAWVTLDAPFEDDHDTVI